MTTLDYATLYETQFRTRRLRRHVLGVAGLIVAAIPLACALLLRFG